MPARSTRPIPLPRAPRPAVVLTRTLLAAGLAACGAASQAQVWLPTSGTRNWFDAANWSGGAVPATGGNVFISAGGAAVADPGLGTLPLLSNLLVGTDETGRGLGALSIVPAGPLAASPLNLTANLIVGRARTTALAQGSVLLDSGSALGLSLGEALSPLDGTRAQGTLSATGSFILGGGVSSMGAAIGGGRDAFATGRLDIGGDAGSAMLRWVGATESADASSTGKRADGEVRIRGDFTLDTGVGSAIGRTVGADRVIDPLAPGGFRRDTAIGSLTIEGVGALRGTGVLSIGATGGGSASGAVTIGRLDAGDVPKPIAIGLAGLGGTATGSFVANQGDLATAGRLEIGVARGGNAQGSLVLSNGRLHGDGSELTAGAAMAAGSMLPLSEGRGSLSVRSIEGYRALYAGLVRATGAGSGFADGTSATGALTAGSGSILGPLTGLAAGWASLEPASTGQVSAGGRMVLGGTAQIDRGAEVHVGSLTYGDAGSRANGDLRVTLGDLQSSGLTYVGRVLSAAGQAGKTALGNLFVRGALAMDPGAALVVAETRGQDRNGALFDTAQGRATLGSLVMPTGTFSSLVVGATEQGQADGRVTIGSVDSRLGGLGVLQVGVVRSALPGGEAHGELNVGGGTLAIIGARIGDGGLGTALGRVALQATRFTAEDLIAGRGPGGRAELVFSDVLAQIDRMRLDTGLWSLERSLADVRDHLDLGADSLLHVEVDGLRRGDEYGAIDAARAALGGALEVDFGDLVFGGDSAVFDLLRSASASGLAGDFLRGVSFVNVPAGYRAWGGQELDGVEIYRVHLERLAVPSPGTLALLLAVLLPLARGRRVTSPARAS